MHGQIRVLIVDDSPTMRQLIRRVLAAEPRILVVGEAGDPLDAREKIKSLKPDVLTLDVEMPRMSGLAFLERLMRLRPMPVVMISTETQRGSAAAIEALSLGAIDCIGKPAADQLSQEMQRLPDILLAAAGARTRAAAGRLAERRAAVPPPGFRWNGRLLLIGSSTGGVDALETVLRGFPASCPPTLITQHMPPGFLVSFAQRLDGLVAPRVCLATDGMALRAGMVCLAPGGDTHLELAGGRGPGAGVHCSLRPGERRSGHRPSVDWLFDSAVPLAGRVVAALLTGMGRDGAEGMLALRRAGARTLAQDEQSSVVFGMPKAALENGAAERALPLDRIARALLDLAGSSGMAGAPGEAWAAAAPGTSGGAPGGSAGGALGGRIGG